jgi:CheY-like chemotaxis protein
LPVTRNEVLSLTTSDCGNTEEGRFLPDPQLITLVVAADRPAGTDSTALSITYCPDVVSAVERLRHEQVDVVLFFPPENSDPTDVGRLRRAAPIAIVVVAAELASADQILQFTRRGADDAIRIPVDPFELEHAVLLARERRSGLEEGMLLKRFASAAITASTANLFGTRPLRVNNPDRFDELVREYADILDMALDESLYKDAHQVPERLRALAHHLAEERVGPRDVVEMHTAAVGLKLRSGEIGRVQGYVEEGKLLLLELMGDIMAVYRSYAAVFWPKVRAH